MCLFRAAFRPSARTPFSKLVGARWSFFGPPGLLFGAFAPLGNSVGTLGQHFAFFYCLVGALGPPLASHTGPETAYTASQNTKGFIFIVFQEAVVKNRPT